MATKRKKTTHKYGGPFPVPVQSVTGLKPAEHIWNYFDGVVDANNKYVTIACSGDAHMLLTMGSFGTAQTNSDGTEVFWLSFEESFFLSYGLGCIFITNMDGKTLNILEQWQLYCSLNAKFPITYTAYHHFRAKSWVPKDGIKFGSQFILYKHGPQFFHSSYAVVLQTMDFCGKFLENSPLSMEKIEEWWKLAGMNRLCSTVAKELVICSVLVPDNVAQIINTPECIKQFKINETVVKRWVASKDRENEIDKNLL